VEPCAAQTNPTVSSLLAKLKMGDEGIYGYDFSNLDQNEEMRLRESVAARDYDDYLGEVSAHHSVPVMDAEVDRFLQQIVKNGLVVDIGGCWGWHWRRLSHTRPDITVFIVDFIRNNLIHARRVLGDDIGRRVFLVHGDATQLIFPDNVFDGYWSVQTLQHIPDFKKAVREALRILKPGGAFANYSLNNQALVRFIYNLMGKKYHVKGNVPGTFHLDLASVVQREQIREVFSNEVRVRYSEVLFSPELGFAGCGKSSFLGRTDRCLSSNSKVLSWIARQQSYHTVKRT
jgi:ubiquinone/menaquinone biosynthesis C-methylase UbiE